MKINIYNYWLNIELGFEQASEDFKKIIQLEKKDIVKQYAGLTTLFFDSKDIKFSKEDSHYFFVLTSFNTVFSINFRHLSIHFITLTKRNYRNNYETVRAMLALRATDMLALCITALLAIQANECN